MKTSKRTAALLSQSQKVEQAESQGKAGKKAQGKHENAGRKAAKANNQEGSETNSATIAKMADVVMIDDNPYEKEINNSEDVINGKFYKSRVSLD